MRHLKLYENFLDEIELDDKELSNMNIDDFLNYDDNSYIDSNGVIHIKNWITY